MACARFLLWDSVTNNSGSASRITKEVRAVIVVDILGSYYMIITVVPTWLVLFA